jgi:hypothetical protein
MAVGGAAYLVARAIREAKVVGFEDLGMEAIYEFTVEDMPVTVAVDSEGNNVHTLAPLAALAREDRFAVGSKPCLRSYPASLADPAAGQGRSVPVGG